MVRLRGLLFIYKIQGEGEKLSLQVWLPLNGNLNNQGLSNYQVSNINATINNSGKIGKCYQFGTGQSYLELPKECMRNLSTECTVSFWIKFLTRNSNYETYFQAGLGGYAWNDYVFGLLRNNNGNSCCFTISNGSSASNASYTTPNLTELNTWYHITLVYKTGHCLIYINGSLYHDYATTIIPAFNNITTITIGCSNAKNYQTNCLMNDFRIYDEALSPKEIKNISRGLVCHYTLSRPSENLLSRYVSPGQQNPNVTSTAGRTNYYGDYGIIIPATESADTYFRLYLKEQLVANETYTISCNASGLLDGTYYRFPLFAQSNTSMGVLNIDHNGICSLTFQMTYSTQSAVSVGNETVYVCFMDDITRALTSGQGSITLTNFKIEKGNIVTPWIPANTDPIYSFIGLDSNIENDVSGYGNDGTRIGTFSWSSDTPRYNTSTYASGSASTYLQGSKLPSEAKTVSLWIKCSKTVNSAIFNDKTSGLQIGLLNSLLYINSLASTAGFTTTHWINDEWNHVVAINNNGTRFVYVNGQPETQSGASNYYLHNSENFWLWKRSYNNSYTFTGSLSDFRVYVTALSEDDVLELYHAPISLANSGTLMTQGEYVEV